LARNHRRRTVLSLVLAAWGVLFSGGNARAQDPIEMESVEGMFELNLRDLLDGTVIAAAKTSQSAEDSPFVVTLITADDIKNWGYQSIDEVLRHVVGFYVVDDHINPDAAIRGISGGLRSESGLIKVMIDGHSVSYRTTAGNWLGPELIPLSAVDHVEVIRGPVSSLYGADAFLGVINVVTRSGNHVKWADVTVGANGSGHKLGSDVDAAAGDVGRTWDVLLSARRHYEDRSGLALPSSSPAPLLPPGVTDHPATGLDHQSTVAFAKITVTPRPSLELVATGYLSAIERGGEFADWTQLSNRVDVSGREDGTRVSLAHGFADLKATATLSPRLKLSLDALGFTGRPTARDRIEVGSDLFFVRREGEYFGYSVESEATWQPLDGLDIVAGVNATVERHQRPTVLHVLKQAIGDMPVGEVRNVTPGGGGFVTLSNPGARVQASWAARSWLSLTGGARFDHHNLYKSQISGRAGVVIEPTPRLHVKLMYGDAFKAPSPLLLYGVPLSIGDIAGNETLSPSYVHTLEGQVVWRARRHLYLTSGLALNVLFDKAEFTQQGIGQVARNLSTVRSLSWETEARLELNARLSAYGNVTLSNTRRSLGGEGYVQALVGHDNVVFPAAIANLGVLGVPLARLPLQLGLEGSFASARRASDTNILRKGASYTLAPYLLLDATLASVRWQLLWGRETSLMLIARNLLGTHVADPGFAGVDYPLLPRRLMLQLRQQF
jgi:outer membrane receptor for ferrienterochelin and colicins